MIPIPTEYESDNRIFKSLTKSIFFMVTASTHLKAKQSKDNAITKPGKKESNLKKTYRIIFSFLN